MLIAKIYLTQHFTSLFMGKMGQLRKKYFELRKKHSKIDQHLARHLSIMVRVCLFPSLSMQSNNYPFL